jgi:hypothetical protein
LLPLSFHLVPIHLVFPFVYVGPGDTGEPASPGPGSQPELLIPIAIAIAVALTLGPLIVVLGPGLRGLRALSALAFRLLACVLVHCLPPWS